MKFEHVLVCTDLSKESVAATSFAVEKFIEKGARVTLLTVAQNYPLPEWPYTVTPEFDNELEEHAAKSLHQIAGESFARYSVKEKVIVALNVAEEIRNTAKADNCDLIIMGSHGAGALANLFIGSTVQRVIKLAECPVLVVPKAVVS